MKLVEALCAEHQINMIKVDDGKKLGEWAGLCKIDKEGKARKVVGCSCVVVKVNNSLTPLVEHVTELLVNNTVVLRIFAIWLHSRLQK